MKVDLRHDFLAKKERPAMIKDGYTVDERNGGTFNFGLTVLYDTNGWFRRQSESLAKSLLETHHWVCRVLQVG